LLENILMVMLDMMMMMLEKMVTMIFLVYPDKDGQYKLDDSVTDNDVYWH
jgi:hypothetical protein